MVGDALGYAAWAAGGVAGGYGLLRAYWSARGAYKLRQAGPRPLGAARHVLWRDPGAIEQLDIASGPGGRGFLPAAPFHFIEEHSSGTQPCVSVHDANGRRWRVKWGQEVRSETFAVRLAWACGYFAEITHFVASGRIEGITAPLTRAINAVDAAGCFVE